MIEDIKADLNRLFIVSKVSLEEHPEATTYTTAKIFAEEYHADTCPRCWNRYAAEELNEAGICARCADVVATYE